MQRHGQLDHAEAGAEMAAGHGDRVDGLLPQFVGQLAKLLRRQVLHVARQADAVEQRCLGSLGQTSLHGRVGARHPAALVRPYDAYTNITLSGNSTGAAAPYAGPVFAAMAAIASCGLAARVTKSSGPQQIR